MSYPTKKLGELVDFLDNQRKPINDEDRQKRIGLYPYYGANGQVGWIDDYLFDEDLVLLAEDGGYFGSKDRPIAYRISGKTWVNNHAHVLRVRRDIAETGFIHYRLMFYDIKPYITGSTRTKLNKSAAEKIKIPLPSLEIQKQIVERLDKIAEAQKLNDELIQKSDELFQSLLYKELNPAGPAAAKAMAGKKDWEIKNIGEVCKIVGGGTPSREELKHFKGDIPWVTVKDLNVLEIEDTLERINKESLKNSAANLVPAGTVLVVTRVGLGKIAIAKKSLTFNQDIKGLIANAEIDPSYLFYAVLNKTDKIIRNGKGATVKGITQEFLKSIKIPVPPVKQQKQIVAKLSAVQEYKNQLLAQKSKLKELFDSALARSMNSGQAESFNG